LVHLLLHLLATGYGSSETCVDEARRSACKGTAKGHPYLLKAGIPRGRTNSLTVIEQARSHVQETMKGKPMPRLPDFSVVVWLRKTDKFAALKTEVLDAAVAEPYESTEYQGMVDFHWSAPDLPGAERLAEALKAAARHPELVLLRIISLVDGVDSISIKDERRTSH
jgi:hypothetical protein